MAKPIMDELKEELENLKKSEEKRVFNALENHEFPPLPLTPATVSKTVNKVLKEHEMTAEELRLVFGQREVTTQELELISELSEEEKNK